MQAYLNQNSTEDQKDNNLTVQFIVQQVYESLILIFYFIHARTAI